MGTFEFTSIANSGKRMHRSPALLILIALLAARMLFTPGAAFAQPIDCERYADETMRLFAKASALGLAAEAQDQLWEGDRPHHRDACTADPENALNLFRARREAVLSAASDAERPAASAQSESTMRVFRLPGDQIPVMIVAGVVLLGIIVVVTRLLGANARTVAEPEPQNGRAAAAPTPSKPLSGYVISGLLGFFIVHAASDFLVQQIGISFTLMAYAAAAAIGATTGALFNAYAASLLGAFTGVIILLSLTGYIIY